MKSAAAFLLSADHQSLWRQINDTATETPVCTMAARLRGHFTQRPDQPAVISARRTLTYRDLAGLAGPLALRLGQDRSPVAISVEPGWEQLVAVVATVLAGAPFLAVPPESAQSSRWGRLAEAGARRLLTQSWLDQRLRWPHGTTVITVDTATPMEDIDSLPAGADRSDVVCLVADDPVDVPLAPLTDAGICLPIADLAREFALTPADRLLAVVPLGDAVGLSSALTMLMVGGATVVPEDIDLHTPAVWVDLIRRERVTVWHSPPALAALLDEHLRGRGDDMPDTLRLALLAGEALPVSLAQRLRRIGDSRVRVANLLAGGSVALWAACHEVGDEVSNRGHAPVGRPLAGSHLYVLSEAQTLCPVWVTGRLYLGPALPAGHHPGTGWATTAGAAGERLCPTNFLGRLLPSGIIDVVGDDAGQLTVAGHPLNLRDIEAALATHPSVLIAAATRAGAGSVAYAKTVSGSEITSAALMDHLRRKMSPFLLPAEIQLVGTFQLTPSGRIDRAALQYRGGAAAPASAELLAIARAASARAVPAETVRLACELAARTLGVPEVGERVNLLDLGATSVQLVRLAVAAEQELGIQVDVEELLRFPSVAVLVSFAETDAAPLETAPAASQETEKIILDPVERDAFTQGQPGLRHALTAKPGVALIPPTRRARQLMGRRATRRRFTPDPMRLDMLGDLLTVLIRLGSASDGHGPKHAYPSAGSLYPVQTYLTVADGRIEGLAGGAYYYHPVEHRLVTVQSGGAVDASAHAWLNREVFRASAFSLYLVSSMNAIAPMYGRRARDYCLIEAGAMLQLLMSAATEFGLGLCPIGELVDDSVRDLLSMDDDQEILHSLLGGIPSDTDAAAERQREAGMLRQVELMASDGAVLR
jgi:SagB-type dehydrogenase family enzyme